jgi:hypothetical protein
MTKKIDAVTTTTVKYGADCLNHDNSEAFERLYLQIQSLETMARETFQYQFRRDYQAVVKKLQEGETLTPADRELLAQLIIAEAKSYVKHEKEYEGWKDRIATLLSALKQTQEQGVRTTEDLLHIQAICRDLRAVLPDITHYLRERERVQSYEQNDLQALPQEMKELLAEIVEAMMLSEKM